MINEKKKVQPSIFDFQKRRNRTSEVIDLTTDFDEVVDVICPICNISITCYSIKERSLHVDKCLGKGSDTATKENVGSGKMVRDGGSIESDGDLVGKSLLVDVGLKEDLGHGREPETSSNLLLGNLQFAFVLEENGVKVEQSSFPGESGETLSSPKTEDSSKLLGAKISTVKVEDSLFVQDSSDEESLFQKDTSIKLENYAKIVEEGIEPSNTKLEGNKTIEGLDISNVKATNDTLLKSEPFANGNSKPENNKGEFNSKSRLSLSGLKRKSPSDVKLPSPGDLKKANKKVKKTLRPVEVNRNRYINKAGTAKVTSLEAEMKPPTLVKSAYNRKPIPTLKIMTFPMTSTENYELSVDAFNFAPHPTISQYILTHFHADHYGGISKKWAYERIFDRACDFDDSSRYRKIIYCTKITGNLLTIRFKIDSRFIKKLEFDTRYLIKSFDDKEVPDGGYVSQDEHPGVYITPLHANHCPGAAIFLFESISLTGYRYYTLHCGDFRVNKVMLTNPLLRKFSIEGGDTLLNNIYLDTTYLSPQYTFPKQELVCESVAQMFEDLIKDSKDSELLFSTWFGTLKQLRITDFMTKLLAKKKKKKKKFLILVGTYLIGKEKLAIAILKKLHCPIYILNIKSRDDKLEIIRNYEDEYLDSVITQNDVGEDSEADCVVHLVPMNIVGGINELNNYFNHNKYHDHFERCVGLRPTGWSFVNRWAQTEFDFTDDEKCLKELANTLTNCQSYSFISNILPQAPVTKGPKGKNKPEAALYRIYTLPYSEHSSYRELSYFGIFFKTGSIIPTVNFEKPESREKMSAIIRLWELFRKIKLSNGEDKSISESTYKLIKGISLENF